MKINDVIKILVSNVDIDNYDRLAKGIGCMLSKNQAEQLAQIVKNGPIWDGDVISKESRNELIDIGLAVRVCCKGEVGYTGGTYFAQAVVEYLNEKNIDIES